VSRTDLVLLAVSAILVNLAYPPFHLLVPSFVCLIPALVVLAKSNNHRLPLRTQLVIGFWFGVLVHGLLLYWMVIALWRYTPLSVFGYVGTVLLFGAHCSLFFALIGWIIRATGLSLVAVFPIMWTAQEWLIAHQGDLSFPWLGLGTTLTGYPTLVQLADLVGARGVTFLLALANAALAVAWLKRANGKEPILRTAAVAVCTLVVAGYGVFRESTVTQTQAGTVALIQPNIDYRDKWNPDLQDSILGAMVEMSLEAHRSAEPDLIVWPEGSIPGDLFRRPQWFGDIRALATDTKAGLVIGGRHDVALSDSTYVRYNSAFIVDSAGLTASYPVYHKRRLVPVTEKVPFVSGWTGGISWIGNFGVGENSSTYDLGIGKFGILICFESTFEQLARDYRNTGADFLVNITNDSWFGRTTTPYQHAAHLVMRAIENRIGIARAANTGISLFVDPLGRTYEHTGTFESTLAVGQVRTSEMFTAYSLLGDWVGAMSVLAMLVLLGSAWWREKQLV